MSSMQTPNKKKKKKRLFQYFSKVHYCISPEIQYWRKSKITLKSLGVGKSNSQKYNQPGM